MAEFDENDRKKISRAQRIRRENIPKVVKNASDSNLALACLYAGLMKVTTDTAAINELTAEIVKVHSLNKSQCAAFQKAAAAALHEDLTIIPTKGIDLTKLDFPRQVEAALWWLEKHAREKPTLFRHGHELAEIADVAEIGVASIDVLTRDQFHRALNEQVPCFITRGDGKGAMPEFQPVPDGLMKHIYAMRTLPLPYLERIARAPVFAADGKLIVVPGYNRSALMFYAPPADLVVPELPNRITDADLSKARQIIVEEWMGDIPFDGWNRDRLVNSALGGDVNNPPPASLLNAIGAAIEQFVRPMIAGPLPPHLMTKPTERTGATLLATTIKLVVEGLESVQTLADSEEEREKRIVANLRSGVAVNILDNVKGEIDSPVLASYWTAPVFEGRILSKSDMVRLPVTDSKFITGNNPKWSTELAARLGLIRIDARCAEPGKRSGFRHADLPGWVRANRGEIIWALLVLIQNWIEKDKPGPVTPVQWGSYENYVKVMGGIIGAAAPNWSTWQTNRDQIAADVDSGEFDPVIQLIEAWVQSAGDDSNTLEGMYTSDQHTKHGNVSVPGLASIAITHRITLPVKRNPGGEAFDYNTYALGTWLGSLKDRFFKLSDGSEYKLVRGVRTKLGYPWSLLTKEDVQTQEVNATPAPIAIVVQPEVVAPKVVASSSVTTFEQVLRRSELRVITADEKAAWYEMSDAEQQAFRMVMNDRIAKAA